MVKVKYNWFHLPELCSDPNHEKDCFATGRDAMQFLDERAALDQFTRWNGEGAVRCYQYAVTQIERVPHGV